MKYNFCVVLVTLDGEPMTESFVDKDNKPQTRDITVGRLVASQLASSNDPDPLKMMSLAKKMYHSTEPIELDESDKKKIEIFIEENKQLVNLVRAQALHVLSNPIK